MQLLASLGAEGSINGFSKGLKLIEGKSKVENLKNLGSTYILPHIGWNNIKIKIIHPSLKIYLMITDFYFVHSFAYNDINQKYIIAETNYGTSFPMI